MKKIFIYFTVIIICLTILGKIYSLKNYRLNITENINTVSVSIVLKNNEGLFEKIVVEGEENTLEYIIDLYSKYSYSLPPNYINPLPFNNFHYVIGKDKVSIITREYCNKVEILDFLNALYLSSEPFQIKEIECITKTNKYFVNEKTIKNVE